jgi:hypothetical protein
MIGTLMAKRGVAGAFDALNRHDLATFPGHQAASRWPMPPP